MYTYVLNTCLQKEQKLVLFEILVYAEVVRLMLGQLQIVYPANTKMVSSETMLHFISIFFVRVGEIYD